MNTLLGKNNAAARLKTINNEFFILFYLSSWKICTRLNPKTPTTKLVDLARISEATYALRRLPPAVQWIALLLGL